MGLLKMDAAAKQSGRELGNDGSDRWLPSDTGSATMHAGLARIHLADDWMYCMM